MSRLTIFSKAIIILGILLNIGCVAERIVFIPLFQAPQANINKRNDSVNLTPNRLASPYNNLASPHNSLTNDLIFVSP